MDLRLAARTCLAALGEFARALALGREAEPLAKALDDPRREALIHCSVSIALTLMGRSTEAIEPGKRAWPSRRPCRNRRCASRRGILWDYRMCTSAPIAPS